MSLGISFGSFTCIILVPVGTLLSCLWLKLIWLGCRATVVYVYILDIPHRSALQSMSFGVSWMRLFIARYYHSDGLCMQAWYTLWYILLTSILSDYLKYTTFSIFSRYLILWILLNYWESIAVHILFKYYLDLCSFLCQFIGTLSIAYTAGRLCTAYLCHSIVPVFAFTCALHVAVACCLLFKP